MKKEEEYKKRIKELEDENRKLRSDISSLENELMIERIW